MAICGAEVSGRFGSGLPGVEKSLYLAFFQEIIIAMAPLNNHKPKTDRTDSGDYSSSYRQNVQ
ncbi:MAG TPA: hypothetical protein VKT33_14335 [Candidatus Angelobacter sp.]|nr:hypothetical protein [Candidatus Angelobacter sp.]